MLLKNRKRADVEPSILGPLLGSIHIYLLHHGFLESRGEAFVNVISFSALSLYVSTLLFLMLILLGPAQENALLQALSRLCIVLPRSPLCHIEP